MAKSMKEEEFLGEEWPSRRAFTFLQTNDNLLIKLSVCKVNFSFSKRCISLGKMTFLSEKR